MKLTIDGLKNMYAIMCSKKPEPVMIEQKTIDELTTSGNSRNESFARWLTVLIIKCAEMAENTALGSLVPIAHCNDTRFLAKMAMRFILTVIQMERGSVTQWVR